MVVTFKSEWEVQCSRCPPGAPPVPAGGADLHHPKGSQPYYTCAWHSLVEGVPSAAHMDGLLSIFPRIDPFAPKGAGGCTDPACTKPHVTVGHERMHGIAPYPYQAEDARRTATMRALLVGSQQGVGKTISSSLGALRADMGNLIFCPTSVVKNWWREIQRWRPDLVPRVSISRAAWKLPRPGVVVVSSWGLLPGTACAKCRADGGVTCLCNFPVVDQPYVLLADEIHYIQNQNARQRKWDLLRDRVWDAGGRLYGLTGTPVSNNPKDLWEILCRLKLERAAFPGGFNEFLGIFWQWFGEKKGERSVPDGATRQALLEALRPVRICRLRKHVLKWLPPVQEKIIEFDLGPQQLAEIDEAVQRMLAQRRAWADVTEGVIADPWGKAQNHEGKKVALSEDEKARRLGLYEDRVKMYFETRPWVTDVELREAIKQAIESRHQVPHITELARIRAILALSKIKTVLEIVEQCEAEEEPAIVFSQHVELLKKLFDGRKGWGLYHGGISKSARDDLWQGFQRGDEDLKSGLGVSITAGAEGINLTRASIAVCADKHWNPAKNDQAIARLLRPGSERHESITVITVIANHAVDRLLQVTLQEKGALQLVLEDDEMSMSGLSDLAESMP